MLVAIISLSCVGKSAVMLELQQRHSFKFIRNYSTRQYRDEEHTKISITENEFNDFQVNGSLDFVNEHYGFKYAFSRTDIVNAINVRNECYMIDFSIQNIQQLEMHKDIQRFILIPEAKDIFESRVLASNRASRFNTIMNEYDKYYSTLKEGFISELNAHVVINVERRLDLVADTIVRGCKKLIY